MSTNHLTGISDTRVSRLTGVRTKPGSTSNGNGPLPPSGALVCRHEDRAVRHEASCSGTEERWWATQYRDGRHQTHCGTRGEVEAAAGGTWGFVFDAAYGNNLIRRPEGDLIAHPHGLPEVSDSAAVMLFLLMSFPGRWHDPFTISRLRLCEHLLQNGNCSQCTKRLRRVFGEGGKPGYHELIHPFYFILTRRYPHALRWNTEATFIVIEPEAQLRGACHHGGHVFPTFHLNYWRVRGLPVPPSISGDCDSKTA